MTKILFKFNASTVDSIEKRTGESIGNALTNTTISNIATFVELASVSEEGKVGMSRSLALKSIDAYLEEENDMDDLVLDITEQLVADGFLSRGLSVGKMRALKESKVQEFAKAVDRELNK